MNPTNIPLNLSPQHYYATTLPPRPNKHLLSLISITLLKSIDAQFGGFIQISRDSVHQISLLIYQKISELIIQSKDLSAMQGCRLINSLQLVYLMFSGPKKIDLNSFFQHLLRKQEKKMKKKEINQGPQKYELEKFIKKHYLQEEYAENEIFEPKDAFKNIFSKPPEDYSTFGKCMDPLFSRKHLSEIIKKPEKYCIERNHYKIDTDYSSTQIHQRERESEINFYRANQGIKKIKRNIENPSKMPKKIESKIDRYPNKFSLSQFI